MCIFIVFFFFFWVWSREVNCMERSCALSLCVSANRTKHIICLGREFSTLNRVSNGLKLTWDDYYYYMLLEK